PVPPARQFAAAVNSFGPRLGLDTILTITQARVIALGALLLLSGHQAWPLPELGRYAAVFVAFAALTYVMVGLILIQNLGRVGLGLAEIRVVQQLAISWRLFRRHFELVGFRALCLLLELMLLVPFIAAAATLLIMTPPSLTWVVALGLMVLATTAGALLGGGTAAWWETAYRHLIQSDYPSDTGSLLSGRAAGKPQPFALAVTAGLAGMLIVAAVAWPWLSLYI
ncbi:MAG TPA: hypothetical protein VLF67_01810, partial [Candidatus Saccharimonas sp.]|nr:hypothetical protein [Candidatus Saccharimonas sp.]